MDYVYICRKGENEELRYSIRSLVKNLPDARVWLVGYKPSWYTGNFIPVKDTSTKFNNIHNALKVIANHPEISDDFVLMNDDFFILKPMSEIPVTHGGLLIDKIREYYRLSPSSYYAHLLSKANTFLINHGIYEALDYDLHMPMPINKTNLIKTISYKHMPRSVYGNLNNVGGIKKDDVKAYSGNSRLSERSISLNDDAVFLSTEDDSFENTHKETLQKMFPEPSQYELV